MRSGTSYDEVARLLRQIQTLAVELAEWQQREIPDAERSMPRSAPSAPPDAR
jgi:hypothetical protein